jgi:hypothetical protein
VRFSALLLLVSCVLVHFVEFVVLLCYEMGKYFGSDRGALCGKWKVLHCGT